ncbi:MULTISPECIES: type II toxin-antitoxin system PemK/MazF family toxin [Catenuloplanes]|uniref:PemK-like, MazF-like toxin of type II toxin-antitoxin system n=1 Tax=Catenuloplanes niger TaxID=587534 RepID=A0AAE3ZV73_9ACTN|nr:type II toxin-antitoxin system PemK/MazF family toxin [Catenuloplanes niger]MDR7325577.1 hypothetical protein [Catenuloplanes niger]
MAGILRGIADKLTGRTSAPVPAQRTGGLREGAAHLGRRLTGRPTAPPGTGREGRPARPTPATARIRRGRQLAYAPELDGRADPGEIVWTWVAYEDDASQGKDRPVLVVGRDGRVLLGLMLSSQSERQGQRHWLALGPGDWDRDKRPSFVRLDRVIQVREDGIRREGAILDRQRFDRIADVLRHTYSWG